MHLDITPDDLRPIVRTVVAEMLAREPLAYSEERAAELLGVRKHVLRDLRLRGEIRATKIGRCWHYSRAALMAYLEGRPQ